VYGNGVFVTVGQTGAGNRAMLSTSGTDPQTVLGRNNGGTWATTTVPYNGASYSVAYGNGIFVALVFTGIAVDNKYMTSPDGLNWTARTFPTSDYWYKIIYGDGKFVVAMLLGSTVLTSTDALSWATTSTSMATTVSLAYGKGTYVALTSGLAAASSNDAITWTARSTPSPLLQWSSVTYGNGLFVAVSSTATTSGAMTSPDGINWTLRTTPNTNLWQSVTFGNGLFVAVSNSGLGNRVMTSPDGITWTARTSPANFNWIYQCKNR
jgi:hypothetical protein